MVWHLIWEEGVQNLGKIFVCPLPLLRESVCNIIYHPHKPLAKSLHIHVQTYLRVFSCRIDASQCLDGVIAGLAEIWLFHPAFGHCASTVHSLLGYGICQWCLSTAWLLPQRTQADCLTRGRAGCLEFWSATQCPDCCNRQGLLGMSQSNKFCRGSGNRVSSYLSPPLICGEFLASMLSFSCNSCQLVLLFCWEFVIGGF